MTLTTYRRYNHSLSSLSLVPIGARLSTTALAAAARD